MKINAPLKLKPLRVTQVFQSCVNFMDHFSNINLIIFCIIESGQELKDTDF